VEGRSDAYNQKTSARYHVATAGYFRALEIPLLNGRFFDGREDANGPFVIIVNESMANRYWPGRERARKTYSFRSSPQEKDWMQNRRRGARRPRISPTAPPSVPRSGCRMLSSPNEICSSRCVLPTDPVLLANQFRSPFAELDPELAVPIFVS